MERAFLQAAGSVRHFAQGYLFPFRGFRAGLFAGSENVFAIETSEANWPVSAPKCECVE